MILSNRTSAIVATFTAVATTMAFTGCENAAEEAADTNDNYGETELTDDNGNPYKLIQNADGTETAKYPDGKEVTFKRDEDGNMNFVSGTAGLLAGLAAGYFLFHGMNYNSGYASGNNYYSNSRPTRMSYSEQKDRLNYMKEKREEKKSSGGSASTKAATSTGNSSSSSGTSSSSSSKSNVSSSKSSSSSSSVKSSSSTAKGGFGSAGARGGSAVS